jgi:hypothetical protein
MVCGDNSRVCGDDDSTMDDGTDTTIGEEREVDPADIIAMGMLHCPMPCWVKSWPSLRMLIINKAYEDIYGIEAASYVGSDDDAVWGSDTSELFHSADIEAFESGSGVERQETFRNPKTGIIETANSVKWPIRFNETTVGIAGIITRRTVGGLAPAAPGER